MKKKFDVLLVEDNPDDALVIREMLADAVLVDCRVEWVSRLSLAERWLEKNLDRVDIVILDLLLPDSGSIDTLMWFKPYVSRVPFVVLTGIEDGEMGWRAIKGGAQDYICKNEMDPGMLENSLQFAIERHQLLARLQNQRDQLAKNERRLRRIIEKNADGIVIINGNGGPEYLNPAAKTLVGGDGGGADPRRLDLLRRHLDDGGETVQLAMGPGQTPPLVEMRVKAIDWRGKPARLATLRDITAFKALENSYLLEKERLEITLRSIGDGVMITGADGTVRSVNGAVEQLTGCAPRNTLGRAVTELLNPEDFTYHFDGSPGAAYGTGTIQRDGEDIILEFSRAPIMDIADGIQGHVLVIRDTTLQKKMVEEMIKVRKLEALGRVAGKLAREYDDVFGTILRNLRGAQNRLKEHRGLINMLEKSKKSTLKARELTRQLHTFSRCHHSVRHWGFLTDVLKDVLKTIPNTAGITCRWDIAPGLRPVGFNRKQMIRALQNIARNAVDAMPGGGLLEISMDNTVVSDRDNYHLGLSSGEYVRVSIKDSGGGMDKNITGNIFDPFFTTREGAVGMGLTTAFSIIRRHRGTIEVESAAGIGSRFNLFLPAADVHGQNARTTPGEVKII